MKITEIKPRPPSKPYLLLKLQGSSKEDPASRQPDPNPGLAKIAQAQSWTRYLAILTWVIKYLTSGPQRYPLKSLKSSGLLSNIHPQRPRPP
jgi:hypothetical protein